MKRALVLLVAALLAGPALGQTGRAAMDVTRETVNVDGSSFSYSTIPPPSGCTTGSIAAFLGSLTCVPGLTFASGTLSVPGAVSAQNFNAIPLPAAGAVTVTPKLSPLGGITVVAGAALADGDALSVGDGVGVVPIEFDAAPGDGTTGGAVAIVFDGTETATEIRDAVKAILDASGRDWTTSNQGADGIGLIRATPGASGGAITEAVADAGFTVNDWTAPTAATTYTYSLQACLADGTCNAAGAASSTAAGVATLSAANPNRLTWSGVPGSALYKIRRDVGGATQGVIWSGTALTVDDTGLAGDSSAKPTVDGTGVVTAGRVLAGDGTAAAPSVALNGGADGFYYGSSAIRWSQAGVNGGFFTGTALGILSNAAWLAFGALSDTILTRAAAATLQFGAANAASPVAQTLKFQNATGTNANAAATATVKGPAGTGTGTPGVIKIQTAQTGTSGSTAHSHADRLTIGETYVDTNIGTGTAVARVGGVLHVSTTAQATTGTSEEILAAYTMPGNTLARYGQMVRITASAVGAANANSKTFRVRFGGIGGTIVSGTTSTTSTGFHRLVVDIIRTGAVTQLAVGAGTSGVTGGASASVTVSEPTQTLSGAVDIVVTGLTGTSAGDLTFKSLVVEALN